MRGFTMNISVFIQNFLSHRLAVNKMIKISTEPIRIESTKFDGKVDIPVPSSHAGVRPIPCRLLSATARDGMVGERSKTEPSKYLVIHTHGGVSSSYSLTYVCVFEIMERNCFSGFLHSHDWIT
jgi:hypothetical protein